jgi:class 3 adenylate cyclase
MISFTRRFKLAIAVFPFLLLLSIIVIFLRSNPLNDRNTIAKRVVSDGFVDLSENRQGITQLKGDWEFVWKEFVSERSYTDPTWGRFPGSWRDAGIKEHFGWGTYVLRVSGLDPDLRYAFSIGQTISACRIVINEELVVSLGVPGTTRETEIPGWGSVLAYFKPASDGSADIAVQISNYHDRYGGTNASLYLGEAGVMFRMQDRQKMTEIFIFAILGVMALFFWALYFFRKKDVHFSWFAAICAIVAFRTLCYDSFLLLDLFPGLSWQAFFRLGYATFPLAMIFYIGFLKSMYPGLLNRFFLVLFTIPHAGFLAIITFLPVLVPAFILPFMQVFGLATVVYGFVVIVRAVLVRDESALWLAAGFSFAIITFFYDIFVAMWILSGISLTPIGMSLCLFCIAIMVIEQYSSSFRKTRELSAQLHATNCSLRRFVPAEFLSFLHKASISEVLPGDCVDVEMAVLSADIRAFTTIAENMTPAEVFAFLNEYLELVAPVIRRNGGFIAKYEGDGFTALFPSGAEAALHAGVQVQAAIARRNREHPDKPYLTVGIGIDNGPLALGAIGVVHRMDGTVISSCVKGAAHFESTTKLFHSKILISEAVYFALSDPSGWQARPVDRVEIGDRVSFLFEVYSTEPDDIRELKWKTQDDLEHAVFSWFLGQHDEARVFLARVLSVFPEDPVAKYYETRLS